MDWIVLEGVKPWDGRYPLDPANMELTTREWGWIKRLTGYLPLTVQEGFDGGDPELFAAFAVIAPHRAGRIDKPDVPAVYDRIADAPAAATVRLESDSVDKAEEADDESPPPARPAANGNTSGEGSPTSSETSELTPNGSGTPGSAGQESGSVTLATSHRGS